MNDFVWIIFFLYAPNARNTASESVVDVDTTAVELTVEPRVTAVSQPL